MSSATNSPVSASLKIRRQVFDGGLDRLNKLSVEMMQTYLIVGFIKSVAYDNGATVPEVAFWNEFGTKRGIPPRPFLRPAIYNNTRKYKTIMRLMLKNVLAKKITVKTAWGLLGQQAVLDVRKQIEDTRTPPNALSVILRKTGKVKPKKGRFGPFYSHPLLDTGKMRQAVSYSIQKYGA